jgi:DNA-binding XRE family transcriptional regulator
MRFTVRADRLECRRPLHLIHLLVTNYLGNISEVGISRNRIQVCRLISLEPAVPKSIHTRQYRVFTQLLAQLRLDAHVTQAQLAAKLGIPQSRVSKIEIGERRLDVVELRVWCLALNASIEKFVVRFEQILKKS